MSIAGNRSSDSSINHMRKAWDLAPTCQPFFSTFQPVFQCLAGPWQAETMQDTGKSKRKVEKMPAVIDSSRYSLHMHDRYDSVAALTGVTMIDTIVQPCTASNNDVRRHVK